jgi:hypothetical protein
LIDVAGAAAIAAYGRCDRFNDSVPRRLRGVVIDDHKRLKCGGVEVSVDCAGEGVESTHKT